MRWRFLLQKIAFTVAKWRPAPQPLSVCDKLRMALVIVIVANWMFAPPSKLQLMDPITMAVVIGAVIGMATSAIHYALTP